MTQRNVLQQSKNDFEDLFVSLCQLMFVAWYHEVVLQGFEHTLQHDSG